MIDYKKNLLDKVINFFRLLQDFQFGEKLWSGLSPSMCIEDDMELLCNSSYRYSNKESIAVIPFYGFKDIYVNLSISQSP